MKEDRKMRKKMKETVCAKTKEDRRVGIWKHNGLFIYPNLPTQNCTRPGMDNRGIIKCL